MGAGVLSEYYVAGQDADVLDWVTRQQRGSAE